MHELVRQEARATEQERLLEQAALRHAVVARLVMLHAKVLDLSEKHAAFKAFVETVKPDAMARLDQLTVIA